MTKLRPANTFEGYLEKITDRIGVNGAAKAVGRAESHIYKWLDPDAAAKPNIFQCAILDAASIRAGGKPEITRLLNQWMSAVERDHAQDISMKNYQKQDCSASEQRLSL